MRERPRRRKKTAAPDTETMVGLLAGALQRHHDFILTFEEDDEGKRVLHLISGKLITPCMLGTLTNRVELQQDEGAVYIRRELS